MTGKGKEKKKLRIAFKKEGDLAGSERSSTQSRTSPHETTQFLPTMRASCHTAFSLVDVHPLGSNHSPPVNILSKLSCYYFFFTF